MSHVSWWGLVWFTKHIRKHALMCFLAIENKVITRDRLAGLVFQTYP